MPSFRGKIRLGICVTALTVLLVSFQNCSNNRLQKNPSPEVISKLQVIGDVCLEGPYQNYTLASFYTANMNLIFLDGIYAVDSDTDGIADKVENEFTFTATDRHTKSNVLDSICLDASGDGDCSNLLVTCNDMPNKLGLSDCDIDALKLNTCATGNCNHPDQGLDTDKDGIPDILEIVRGTKPNVFDISDDPDNDKVLNRDEIRVGTNPLFNEKNPDPDYKIKSDMSLSPPKTACAGENYLVNVDYVPLVKALSFNDPLDSRLENDGLSLSHTDEENVVVLFLKLRPKVGQSGNAVVLYKEFKPQIKNVNNFENIDLSSFKIAGEVIP